ncbi:MAG TPA: tetratricopeptide repeat protein [Polyangiaceae bacterium]
MEATAFDKPWRSPAVRIASVICALAFTAFGFIPQFGGPGYESALAAGLVLPSLCALALACEVSARTPQPRQAFGRALTISAWLAALGCLIVLLHGVRVGFCDVLWGLELYALGPLPGAVLAGVWGAAVGLLAARVRSRARRRVWLVAGSFAAPFAGVLVSFARFYTSPMVFAFDPFFGYFSGPLYDTVLDPVGTLLTYRAGTALTLLALAGLSEHVRRGEHGFVWVRLGRPGWTALLGLCALGSVALTLSGSSFGHYSTASSIVASLGQRVSAKRCDVVYSSAIPASEAQLFARDCDAELAEAERYFATRGPEHVRAYLFANEAEKGRLMGASSTYIAKPWRREIYVQYAPYPHPVVGHELAHVVAGSFGVGPFRVSGPLGGLIPDPGRIEGVAVAASPGDADDFTLEQWARTLLDLELLPPLASVFRLGFLGQNSATAYTVAGAFVSFLHERFGAVAVRRWYGGDELSAITGRDLAALEREWRSSLSTVKVSEALLHEARVRFDRPALFGRPCPRIVDRLEGVANQKLAALDTSGARAAFDGVLRLEPHNVAARFGLVGCSVKAGDAEGARRGYEALAKAPELAVLERASAREAEADLELRRGNLDQARAGYDEVAALVADEDRLRTLDVKRTPRNELERRGVVELLIGDVRLGPSWDLAAISLTHWAEQEPLDGLPHYLLGKNLYGHGHAREGADELDQAIARRLESSRVRREALRMRLISGCALADLDAAASALAALRADPDLNQARRASVEHLARRCEISSRVPSAPETTQGHGAQ